MGDYTPTTEEVRAAYLAWSDGQDDSHPNKPAWSAEEFDRWLTAHDAEKRAEWEAETEWEYGWAGDKHATVFYDTQEEAEEFMGAPKKFARRKAGPWEAVDNGG